MLISLKHRFVFLCMPKPASKSIEAMLEPYCEIHLGGSPQVRHTNVRDYAAYIRPWLTGVAGVGPLETICVFRDPLAWLGSWYRFRSRYQLRSTGHPHCTAHVGFPEFIEAYTLESPPAYADVGSQFDFVRTESGAVGIDRLFAYQRLGELTEYFSTKVGRRLRLKALNVSPRKVQRVALLEHADAWRRRVSGKLGLALTSVPEQSVPALPDTLRSRLESHIRRDFEMYRQLERMPPAVRRQIPHPSN